ncbi:hypothetical protein HHL08_06110 [Sphingobium sp. AR-3-1]|uniref:Uncharacterized protein n=1 Tax=Sphingobium psychrophilum TaxID=2728834 RepID=A0A7X9WTR0_9SPHN|nr:hypothetical protein [Sphingobium psychrophilum]NML09725.1 hypothetical protein [Sphingobium psychrophilum]
MDPIYSLFFVCYAIGFLLVAFLWRWYLLPIGVGLLLLLWWVIRGVFNEDSPGVIVAAPMVGLAFLGVLAGLLAALIVLLTRKLARRWASPVVILPATFFTVPVVVFGLLFWQQTSLKARRAPPSASCLARLHPVVLGGTPLALPLAPALSVGQGREYDPNYPLDLNEKARKFCAETSAGPIKITNLTARLTPDYSRHLAVRRSTFCASAKPYGWWHDLCRREHGDNPPSEYPREVSFYVLGEYNARKMHAFSADELERLKVDSLTAKELGRGVRRYGDGHYSYFTRRDVPGYLARCYSTGPVKTDLACVAGYRLTPRIGIIYEFATPADAFAEKSVAFDQRARQVFESLK